MTLYPGTRSLDAEIILNFVEGTVTMDYTLNKFGNPHASNSTVILKSEWKDAGVCTKIIYTLQSSIINLFLLFIETFVMVIITELIEHGIIKSPNSHFNHQSLIKWTLEKTHGICEDSKKGALKDTILNFYIGKNVWFSYELSGEYKEKIKSISFLRNIQTIYKFGKFKEEKQNGWIIRFEFIDPPQNGSVTITYV